MTQKDSWWSRPPIDDDDGTGKGERSDARPAQLALTGKARPLTMKSKRHAPLLRFTARDMALVAAIHTYGGVLTTVQIATKFWPPDVARKLQGMGFAREEAQEIAATHTLAQTNERIDLYRWLCRIDGLLKATTPPAAQQRTTQWLKHLYREQRGDFHELATAAEFAAASDGRAFVLDGLGERSGLSAQAGTPPRARGSTESDDGGAVARLFATRPQLPSETVSSACKARLGALVQQSALEAWEQPIRLSEGRAQSCWYLTREGRNLLAGWMGVKPASLPFHPAGSYGTLHLGHRLLLNDLRIAIEGAAERKGYRVVRWIDDNDLKRLMVQEKVTLRRKVQDMHGVREDEAKYAVKIPDGYFVLELGGGKKRHCFVELDNQTLTLAYAGESTKDFAHKVRTMAAFYRSGRYQRLFPEAGDSMWYLTVTTGSEKRLANLKATTEMVMGPGNRAADRYWFARKDDLPTWQDAFTTAAFTPIWERAGQSKKWALDE